MKKQTKRFTGLDMPRSREYHLADHEILLSFNGDSDAAAFNEWWHEKGSTYFQTFLDKQKEQAEKMYETPTCTNCRRVVARGVTLCGRCSGEV